MSETIYATKKMERLAKKLHRKQCSANHKNLGCLFHTYDEWSWGDRQYWFNEAVLHTAVKREYKLLG